MSSTRGNTGKGTGEPHEETKGTSNHLYDFQCRPNTMPIWHVWEMQLWRQTTTGYRQNLSKDVFPALGMVYHGLQRGNKQDMKLHSRGSKEPNLHPIRFTKHIVSSRSSCQALGTIQSFSWHFLTFLGYMSDLDSRLRKKHARALQNHAAIMPW